MPYDAFESLLFRCRERVRDVLETVATPLALGLAKLKVSPNQVSSAGFALNVVAAVFVATGDLAVAGAVYLFAGCMDLMDGTLARVTGRVTKFGAFFDSTIDRISEGVVFAAIGFHFAVMNNGSMVVIAVLALLGSLLVSYVRARAEGLGASCKVGLLTRAERVVLLAAGLLFGVLSEIVILIAVLTAITVVQRVHHVAKELSPVADSDEAHLHGPTV
jgi:phosphatidylinositol phosphate synthase